MNDCNWSTESHIIITTRFKRLKWPSYNKKIYKGKSLFTQQQLKNVIFFSF